MSCEKDWPTLLHAVAGLSEKTGRPCIIEQFGDGPLKAELESLASQLGVNIIWHGWVSQEMLATSFRKADLFVLPSTFEGLGLAVLEAMAMGIPSITADFPASNDFIIPGETGHTFPVGDYKRLQDLIVWHINNPEESSAIGLRSREFIITNYSSENYERYLDIYKEILSERR